jgi:hypothetical protein
MEYPAIEVGTSPKTGLKVFRRFKDMFTYTADNYIRIDYVEYHLGIDGSKLLEKKYSYTITENFDAWRTHDVTVHPAGTTLEQVIVGAVNQTLSAVDENGNLVIPIN